MTLFLGLLARFWKPLLLGVLILTLAFFVNRWDNKRLEAAYKKGYDAAFWNLEQEEKRIIRESEKITQENARQLNFLENQQELKREVVYEQINTYIKETVYECKPDPEYLRLYDAATAATSEFEGTIRTPDRGTAITEVSSTAKPAG